MPNTCCASHGDSNSGSNRPRKNRERLVIRWRVKTHIHQRDKACPQSVQHVDSHIQSNKMGPSYITKVSLFMQAQFITLWWFNGSFYGQIVVHILQTVTLKQMIKNCEDLVLSCWQIMKSFIFICFFFILCYTPVLCFKFSAQRAWLFFWKMQETLQATFGSVNGFFEMMKTVRPLYRLFVSFDFKCLHPTMEKMVDFQMTKV